MLLHIVGLALSVGLFRLHPITAYLEIKFVNLKVQIRGLEVNRINCIDVGM